MELHTRRNAKRTNARSDAYIRKVQGRVACPHRVLPKARYYAWRCLRLLRHTGTPLIPAAAARLHLPRYVFAVDEAACNTVC